MGVYRAGSKGMTPGLSTPSGSPGKSPVGLHCRGGVLSQGRGPSGDGTCAVSSLMLKRGFFQNSLLSKCPALRRPRELWGRQEQKAGPGPRVFPGLELDWEVVLWQPTPTGLLNSLSSGVNSCSGQKEGTLFAASRSLIATCSAPG